MKRSEVRETPTAFPDTNVRNERARPGASAPARWGAPALPSPPARSEHEDDRQTPEVGAAAARRGAASEAVSRPAEAPAAPRSDDDAGTDAETAPVTPWQRLGEHERAAARDWERLSGNPRPGEREPDMSAYEAAADAVELAAMIERQRTYVFAPQLVYGFPPSDPLIDELETDAARALALGDLDRSESVPWASVWERFPPAEQAAARDWLRLAGGTPDPDLSGLLAAADLGELYGLIADARSFVVHLDVPAGNAVPRAVFDALETANARQVVTLNRLPIVDPEAEAAEPEDDGEDDDCRAQRDRVADLRRIVNDSPDPGECAEDCDELGDEMALLVQRARGRIRSGRPFAPDVLAALGPEGRALLAEIERGTAP